MRLLGDEPGKRAYMSMVAGLCGICENDMQSSYRTLRKNKTDTPIWKFCQTVRRMLLSRNCHGHFSFKSLKLINCGPDSFFPIAGGSHHHSPIYWQECMTYLTVMPKISSASPMVWSRPVSEFPSANSSNSSRLNCHFNVQSNKHWATGIYRSAYFFEVL